MTRSDGDKVTVQDHLSGLVLAHEEWLMQRVLEYALARGYSRFTSTLPEPWRLSIAGLSESLISTLVADGGVLEFGPEDDFTDHPAARFGVDEARLHRARGVSLGMFLGLMVYYKQAYLDLVEIGGADEETRLLERTLVSRFFDLLQMAYCTEWESRLEGSLLAELQESNRVMTNEKNRYLTIFDSIAIPALLVDLDGMVESCNAAGAAALFPQGSAPDAFSPDASRRRVPAPGWLRCAIEDMERAEETDRTFEQSLESADGERSFQVRLRRSHDVSRKFSGTVVVCSDVTGEREARLELAEHNRQYGLLFAEMPLGMAVHQMVYDRSGAPVDYRFNAVNPTFESMTGLRAVDVEGRLVSEVLPDIESHWIEMYGNVALTGTPAHFEAFSQGLERWFDVSAYRSGPDTFVTLFSDVTERRAAAGERERLQERLLHSQKLESLGVLAGGIAHDFNNLLVAILGNADLALLDLSPHSPARASVDEIKATAQRASELCRQLLAYSGKGRFVVEPVDLSEIVEEMVHVLKVFVSKKALLRLDLARPLPAVEADVAQIRQVVMNLITNASDAIGDRSGVITLITGVMDCDRQYLEQVFGADDLEPGSYVYLEVSDTGSGMDDQTKASIFDPFFSTKRTGRGLGLAAVMGIVRGHSAAIKVYSEIDKGTSFKMLFPALDVLAPSRDASESSDGQWTTTGTVLLVDDDESVLAVGRRMLDRLGLQVVTAADGKEAVERLLSQDGVVDLVIMDMTMPRMTGEEAFREIRRFQPHLPVILSSGYNEQEAIARFTGRGLAGFIQKPYTLAALREVVRRALEPSGTATGT